MSIRTRWIAAFAAGELIGFGGVPVAGGIAAVELTADWSPQTRAVSLYCFAVAGGFVEGAVLGAFQHRVLRAILPVLPRSRWLLATGTAAAFAWACGMLAPTLDEIYGLRPAAQLAIWLPAGAAILASIGVAQAIVLRGLAAAPWRWAGANVAAWLAGLPWTFALPALLPPSATPAAWIATFVTAGVLMGVTAGTVTAFFLPRPVRSVP